MRLIIGIGIITMFLFGCNSAQNSDTNGNQSDTTTVANDCFDVTKTNYVFQKKYVDNLTNYYGLYYVSEDGSDFNLYDLVFQNENTPNEAVSLKNDSLALTDSSYNTPTGLCYELLELKAKPNGTGGSNQTPFVISSNKVGGSNPEFKDMIYIVIDDKKKKKGKIIVRISTSKKFIE
ncbi:MAG: hypothetical protein ACPGLV_06850 [Bacteroidia bacterium]